MSFLFHFLGGVHFAIALLATTLLFVVAGTFVESWSDSHLLASQLIYHNPVFQVLLWLFFINILFAALRRYPFRARHIPFLLTHLGLLLILGGTLIKSHLGVQGSMGLAEGSGSHLLFLPNTYALQIEDKKASYLVPIRPGKLGPLPSPFPDLELTLIEWTPHSEERIEGWIKGECAHLLGYPPIHIGQRFEGDEFDIYPCRAQNPREVAQAAFQGRPLLTIVQTQDRGEHLVYFDASGKSQEMLYPCDTLYIFDKGYGGYALHFPPLDLYTPLAHTVAKKEVVRKKEELKPRIQLVARTQEKIECVPLTFDRFGSGLKWPLLEGRYLARFQSKLHPIPHHVHLHEARQIHYPSSTQTLSYEGDLAINGQEATLSMNRVHETRDGYRFYLANLVQSSPLAAKQVQIVVNQDPAKYWLTYPGGIVLAIGIVLLYLRRETHA